MPHTDAVVVLTTVASADEGAALVRALLERRLIACGTLLPGSRSLYRWEGKIADESETVILMKTRSAVLHAIEKAFAEFGGDDARTADGRVTHDADFHGAYLRLPLPMELRF